MSDRPGAVRSYQRIFRPERRIHAIDGRTLPIPGGIPLAWLGHAAIAVIAVLTLTARSAPLMTLIALCAGSAAWRLRGTVVALLAASACLLGCVVVGVVLALVDWPLRVIALPAVYATVASQLTPDGRPAHRYATSWLRARLAGRRRLNEPAAAAHTRVRARIRVATDEHHPVLRRGRVVGPATVRFARPLLVRRHRGTVTARSMGDRGGRRARGGLVLDEVGLLDGERLEVRP